MNNNTLDGVKMLHHDEMRNYDRIQGKIVSVIMNHGCKIIETPSFEDYDVYQHFFPQLRQQMVKTNIDTRLSRVLITSAGCDAASRRNGSPRIPALEPAAQVRLCQYSLPRIRGDGERGGRISCKGIEIWATPSECDGRSHCRGG